MSLTLFSSHFHAEKKCTERYWKDTDSLNSYLYHVELCRQIGQILIDDRLVGNAGNVYQIP